MFACLIDCKILSQWEEIDPALKMLDDRIKEITQKYGESVVRLKSASSENDQFEQQPVFEAILASG